MSWTEDYNNFHHLLDRFSKWIENFPAELEYEYMECQICPLAKFLQSVKGDPHAYATGTSYVLWGNREKLDTKFAVALSMQPWNYGALRERLQKEYQPILPECA